MLVGTYDGKYFSVGKNGPRFESLVSVTVLPLVKVRLIWSTSTPKNPILTALVRFTVSSSYRIPQETVKDEEFNDP